MSFKPPHNDKGLRTVYSILFLAFVLFLLIKNPQYNWLYMSLAIACLIGATYLVISFELTTYSYVFVEKSRKTEFFVDKATGKRNNYVCYYHLSDLCCFEKYDEKTKEALDKKYESISFFKYYHNLFTKNKYVLVFKGEKSYEAIIIEATNPFINQANSLIKKQGITLDKIEEQ